MNNKQVSVQSINESIDYLDKEFIAKLDENVSGVLQSYSEFKEKGILSSANIDELVIEIKAKITKLQKDFDDLAMNIKKTMTQSSEDIIIQSSNIEKTMMNNN